MFANTLTLTVDGTAFTLLRVNQDNFGSVYKSVSATEQIVMKIRHSTDTVKGQHIDRHNVTVEKTVFATLTADEKFFSVTSTIRASRGSDPDMASDLHLGVNTLVATLSPTLVKGEN